MTVAPTCSSLSFCSLFSSVSFCNLFSSSFFSFSNLFFSFERVGKCAKGEKARKEDRGVFFVFVRCTLRVCRVDFLRINITNILVSSSSFPPLLGFDVTPFSIFRVFETLLCYSRNSPLMLLSLSFNLMIIIITRLNVLCCCCCCLLCLCLCL